ncbi:hypothetical protein DLM75_06700 [Leptospira stimsonii]|uniref:Uncharacterized protein n=1 Tax=Leptospira stimsonii TaxID=2202203 RepID=A0A396ZBJ2_9LEPT|nr:hypothetical protein DLM75_06700 [Leptospira stimsonii]
MFEKKRKEEIGKCDISFNKDLLMSKFDLREFPQESEMIQIRFFNFQELGVPISQIRLGTASRSGSALCFSIFYRYSSFWSGDKSYRAGQKRSKESSLKVALKTIVFPENAIPFPKRKPPNQQNTEVEVVIRSGVKDRSCFLWAIREKRMQKKKTKKEHK